MESAYLFNLVNLQRGWLSARQSVVAQNIANANTPGYKTVDVSSFSKALDRSIIQMSASNPMHQHPGPKETSSLATKETDAWETSHSGNNVSLEAEMIKAGEIRGAFSLDTNILKSFHSMWLTSLRG